MQTFLELDELDTNRVTKGELARVLYPDDLFNVDYALPQTWLDDVYARGLDRLAGGHAAGHFVTVYPRDGSPMYVAPITAAGVRIAAILATVKR